MEDPDAPCTCGDPNCIPPGYWNIITDELAALEEESACGTPGANAMSLTSKEHQAVLVRTLLGPHASEKRKPVVRIACPECELIYTNNGAMRRHVVTIHHKVYNASSHTLEPIAARSSLHKRWKTLAGDGKISRTTSVWRSKHSSSRRASPETQHVRALCRLRLLKRLRRLRREA